MNHGAGQVLIGPPAIELSGLSVAFPGCDRHAIDHVSLSIERGELVGVSGVSGAGKSTLLRVLAGDLNPTAGNALIDGVPAAAICRTEITWLGQRPYLFGGTLAENIGLGRTDADEAELTEVALAAGLGPLLERLPLGLQTPMGERGWGVSGGEAHRVALARTFLKRRQLILMDEPTAHLDAASESEIVTMIIQLAGHATIIVATHSPALLAACDRVVTLERGHLLTAPVTALEEVTS
jgi:ATP-binding cassette subfamily C protein CydD